MRRKGGVSRRGLPSSTLIHQRFVAMFGFIFLLATLFSVVEANSCSSSSTLKIWGKRTFDRLAPSTGFCLQQDEKNIDLFRLRGGAKYNDEDETDEYDDETDEEVESIMASLNKNDVDENDSSELDAALAASAVKKTVKQKAKKVIQAKTAVKQAVNAKLQKTSATSSGKYQKKKTMSIMKLLHIPYIIRVLFSPSTIYKMTKAYWGSLFDLNYLKQDSSLELRSALEQKAKQGGTGGGGAFPKGRRKMKRGQAKTLSDLPQLSS